jgi:hypothetical protein
MIPHNTMHNTLHPIRTHKHVRTLRSLMTKVGPARGAWSRVRESEDLSRRQRPAVHAKPQHH